MAVPSPGGGRGRPGPRKLTPAAAASGLTAARDPAAARPPALRMADGLEDLLRACTVRVLGGPMPGAGFFVAPGMVVTCVHVIGDSARLTVRWERDGAAPADLAVTRPPRVLPSRGRAIRNLDRDYPDIAALSARAPGG